MSKDFYLAFFNVHVHLQVLHKGMIRGRNISFHFTGSIIFHIFQVCRQWGANTVVFRIIVKRTVCFEGFTQLTRILPANEEKKSQIAAISAILDRLRRQ